MGSRQRIGGPIFKFRPDYSVKELLFNLLGTAVQIKLKEG